MRFILLIAMLIPLGAMSQGWDESGIESRYAGRQLAPIEGVWQFPGDGAKIAIVTSVSDTYDIYLIDSPWLDLKPGLIIGSAIGTPKRDVYDGRLESSKLGKAHKLQSQTVTLTVTDEGSLIIEPYKTGYSLSFRRWLSRIFKVTVIDNNGRAPKGLKGAKRIYPYRYTEHLPICL